jgi:hypothetical protein
MTKLTASVALDRHFLEARGKLLEVAAILDRVDRGQAGPDIQGDPRLKKLSEALAVLQTGKTNRAERLQMIFSIPHESR